MRALVLLPVLLAACTAGPVNPYQAADVCEQRARAAQGPTGEVRAGISSDRGGVFEADIGITDDFIRGRDPQAVYESCVYRKTGEPPVRPPNLR